MFDDLVGRIQQSNSLVSRLTLSVSRRWQRVLKLGTIQSLPISCSKLCTKLAVCRNGSPNSTFKLRQAWIAASLKFCCRPRLLFGGGTQTISGSNQIDSERRRFRLALYEEQFVVLYFVGDQLPIHPSYHAGFMR